ncbi:hypothetical protein DEIPH_ctg062orf0003 [Deinococcus phoenicis]|uniref:Uncharacterized protein n=1 Tax=Deinococcus phoenicis TaxID=1476583 RepID=A0A016QLJ0_9DEIO|nr:hypothetical protein [Deinococcus phoenicis]EYB66928.1 hypothetical protein DEIPH_ctg062orf0003 [Deinococcus phoenicis]
MRPNTVRAVLLIGAALCLTTARAAPTYCPVTVIPDNLLVIAYRAVLRLDRDCPPDGIARVRKASTLNRHGPYRPIKPDGSPPYGGLWSWTLTQRGGNVPPAERWTSWGWTWEWWDGEAWRSAR